MESWINACLRSKEVILFDNNLSILEIDGKRGKIFGLSIHIEIVVYNVVPVKPS